MTSTLILQYILVALIVVFACYSIFKTIKNQLFPKKHQSKRTHCDKDCGCS